MLEKLKPLENASLRDLVGVLVLPLVAKLDDPDGGPDYIRVMAQLIGSPTHSFLDPGKRSRHAGGDRLMRAISRRLSPWKYAIHTIPRQGSSSRSRSRCARAFRASSVAGARSVDATVSSILELSGTCTLRTRAFR